ncbi:23S rRNA (pseudouridine1915-N3)-methyltransferase [Seinonella peptonophila]|uniref:Ribosomal RNA large subunit methyltransferase H n=1 Tax=Seinonella peptonophila TaxID=112248 RepID=A0A1M4WY31_9BACL|nr:23S rRNA (pseudouridine(1915)-N(3))-methyltransferase RlmH [Seinonella peptonophila]SHE85872.1 23S rRNA (pseudouridine1915-N3)-methyltransferase [Seinonella peptonophila]
MRIRLITVGKLKEKYLRQACQEYLKRLQSYAKVDVVELTEASPALSTEQQVTDEEKRMLAAISPDSHVIALAISGEMMSSPQLAEYLQQQTTYGQSHFTCLVGGSYGLSSQVLKHANLQLSFSRLTFPHQLFRVMLLEQLYRSCKINRGEQYHK